MIVTCKSRCEKGGSILNVRQPANRALAKRLGLISWWKWFGNSGSVVRDLMRKNNGTFIGSPVIAGPGGRHGGYGALKCDGTDDRANIPTSTSLTLSSQGTIDGWVKLLDANTSKRLISHGSARIFDIEVALGGKWLFILLYGGGVYAQLQSIDTPTVGRWYHLAATFNGTVLTGYVDGVSQGTQPAVGNINYFTGDKRLKIGSDAADTPTLFANALVDSVRIFNRCLTASQVQSIRADDMRGNPKMLNWIEDSGHLSAGGRLLQLRRACA